MRTNTKETTNACFLAVDLGATSGRTILGSVENGQLIQRELTRFPNRITQLGGHFYWDIYALYAEIIRALRQMANNVCSPDARRAGRAMGSMVRPLSHSPLSTLILTSVSVLPIGLRYQRTEQAKVGSMGFRR